MDYCIQNETNHSIIQSSLNNKKAKEWLHTTVTCIERSQKPGGVAALCVHKVRDIVTGNLWTY